MTKRKVKSLLKGVVIGIMAVAISLTIIVGIIIANVEIDESLEKSKETTYNAEIITNDARHQLFKTNDVQEYLDFLESFDETKYEIVDISTSMAAAYTAEFYMVTYRTIAE